MQSSLHADYAEYDPYLWVPRTLLTIYAFAVLAICYSIAPHILKYVEDRVHIDNDLVAFSVRNVKCFCCETEHMHPESGHPPWLDIH